MPDRAPRRVLVVNTGSSSLKLRVLDRGDLVSAQDLPPPENGDSDALRAFLTREPVDAVATVSSTAALRSPNRSAWARGS